MASNGLLLFTATRKVIPPSCVKHHLQHAAKKLTGGVLYVYQWLPGSSTGSSRAKVEDISSLISRFSCVSSSVYSEAQHLCPQLDVRCLYDKSLGHAGKRPSASINLVMVERDASHQVGTNVITPHIVKKFVSQNFQVPNSNLEIEFVNPEKVASPAKKEALVEVPSAPLARLFGIVGTGGTFDRLHYAHKILITETLIRCEEKTFLGVALDAMTKNKTLTELIQPFEQRANNVMTFANDVAPHIDIVLDPFEDAIGRTTTDNIDLLVGSAETKVGLEFINKVRKEKGLTPVNLLIIDLLNDPTKMNNVEEDKVSSSSHRMRLLGCRVKPPLKTPSLPYVIGLTGGKCSRWETISTFMKALGVPSINCNSMGRTEGIKQQILEQINSHAKQGVKVIILDAEFLLEAKLDNICHEIWVVTISNDESVKRIQSTANVTKEDAEKQLSSQMSNQERVQRATFVFSTMWDETITKSQVTKAWTNIESTIKTL